jgi:hypothetical protein
MAQDQWSVSDLLLETPSQSVHGPHDLMGHGTVHVEGDLIHLAVRPRGLGGLIPTREKRAFPVAAITGWEVAGATVEFTSGGGGLIASNAAAVPVHICRFGCADSQAAADLTDAVIAAGVPTSLVSRRPS